VILLSGITHPGDAATSARKILLSLTAPHSIGGRDLHIDGSIGISVYPEDGQDPETLIKNADTAMYHAKERRSEEHTSELQSRFDLVCRLLLEKKNGSTRTDEWYTVGMGLARV